MRIPTLEASRGWFLGPFATLPREARYARASDWRIITNRGAFSRERRIHRPGAAPYCIVFGQPVMHCEWYRTNVVIPRTRPIMDGRIVIEASSQKREFRDPSAFRPARGPDWPIPVEPDRGRVEP
jgi:hypothetical protein